MADLNKIGPVNYRVRSVSFTVVRESGAMRGRPQLSSPTAVLPVARQLIPDDAREHFVALYLDTQTGWWRLMKSRVEP